MAIEGNQQHLKIGDDGGPGRSHQATGMIPQRHDRRSRGSDGLVLAGALICCALVLGSVAGASARSDGTGYELQGEILGKDTTVSAGGQFRVEGVAPRPEDAPEFSFADEDARLTKRATGCPCENLGAEIFANGFESGNLGAWTASVP